MALFIFNVDFTEKLNFYAAFRVHGLPGLKIPNCSSYKLYSHIALAASQLIEGNPPFR